MSCVLTVSRGSYITVERQGPTMQTISAREKLAHEIMSLSDQQATAIRRMLHDLNLIPRPTDEIVPATAARRAANKWLLLHMGDLLSAGEPTLVPEDPLVWRVPVVVHYERKGVAASVRVNAPTGDVMADEETVPMLRQTVEDYIAHDTSYGETSCSPGMPVATCSPW